MELWIEGNHDTMGLWIFSDLFWTSVHKYSAGVIEILLEKCFFTKEQLSKEEALQAVRFLLGSVEKEAHKK